jgi:hypothetical protein
MNATFNLTAPTLAPTAVAAPRRIAEALALRLRHWSMSPRDRWLQQATSHADLEQRLRAWEAHERQAATFAPLG